MKSITWLGDSLERLREFPAAARQATGYQLERVQAGLEPGNWKPMPMVGIGVGEIRVHAGGAFRVVYLARLPEAVYVLHMFQKKSRATASKDMELARRRFRALIAERRQQ